MTGGVVGGIRTLMRRAGDFGFVWVFVAILIAYMVASHGLTVGGLMNVFRHSAVIGIIAIGMGLVCLIGEIDLSVGSLLALNAGLAVIVFNTTDSITITLVVSLLFGAICGLINGLLVGVVGVPAFITTLATMLVYRSFAQYCCQHLDKALLGGGSSVYRVAAQSDAYQALYAFGNGKVMSVPIVGLVLVAVTAVFIYIAQGTKFGRKLYATGSNVKAARMAGINVPAMKTVVFGLCGLLVGLASFLWVAMNASADPATTGKSYEMYAIAAVVLGGVSMTGGKGRCIGILFGAMSYTIIDKIIVVLKMDSLINDEVKGILLILVIVVQIMVPKIRGRMRA
ncbi:ABC transporter permease [Bifidobacterium simiarum]|uniref:ABC transporter permease n=1 Tax=Bifidobacterium simiarum TaxID=2045441 RepID=UPI001BDD9E37|nr:ABC transporter permease [Bifidobacterium simiarum]MBT1166371.1 ABC transporter permease [Bifidobacterium simiarum]